MDLKIRKPHDKYFLELERQLKKFNKVVEVENNKSAKALGKIAKQTKLFTIAREYKGRTLMIPEIEFKIEGIDKFGKHTWFKIKI